MAKVPPSSIKGAPAPYNYKDYLLTPGSSRRPLTQDPLGKRGEALKGFRTRMASKPAQDARDAYAARVKSVPGLEKAQFDLADEELQEKFRLQNLQNTFAASRAGTYGGTPALNQIERTARGQALSRQQARAQAAGAGQQSLANWQQTYNPLLDMASTGRIGGPAALSTFTPKSTMYPMWAGPMGPMVAGVGWPMAATKPVSKKKVPTTYRESDNNADEGMGDPF